MVEHWLLWARHFGEIIGWDNGKGELWSTPVKGSRRWRVRLTPGVTADGQPFRAQEGFLDILGHKPEDVVPNELMLTSREALVFGMGCAVGRASARLDPENDWQRDRIQVWEAGAAELFRRRREEAREANREERDRERAEWEADRQRNIAEHKRKKEAASRVLEGGESHE
jgi:hypothetical protein